LLKSAPLIKSAPEKCSNLDYYICFFPGLALDTPDLSRTIDE
jgi:hypothetical protein